MPPENTRIFATKPSVNLRGELMGANPPQKADSGSLFTEEFERASRLDSSSDAELRHDSRQEERATQADRAGKQDSSDRARREAQSDRTEAASRRDERSSKRAARREDALNEPSQVGNPNGVDRSRDDKMRKLGTERVQGERRGPGAEPIQAETGRPEQGSTQPSSGTGFVAPQAPGTQAQGASQPAPANTPSGAVQAATTPASVSPSLNAGTGSDSGQLGNRQATPSMAPAGDAPVEAPDARDAMERLLVDRENRMEREASILRQIKASMKPGGRELSIRLSPASLGRVDLNLAVREGRLTAMVRTETVEAYDALERQLPELQAALESHGIEVMGFDLELASDADGSSAFRNHADRENQANSAAMPGTNRSIGDQLVETDSNQRIADLQAARFNAADNRGGLDTVG